MNNMQLPPTNGNQNPNRNFMGPNQAMSAFPPSAMPPPPPPPPPPPQPLPMFPPNAMAPLPFPVQTFRQTLLPFPVFQRPIPIAPVAAPVAPLLPPPPLSQPQAASSFRNNYQNVNQHNYPNQAFNNPQQMIFSSQTHSLRPLAMSKKRKAIDDDGFRSVLLRRNQPSKYLFVRLFNLNVNWKHLHLIF